jgi:hypothetical protein
MFDYKNGSTLMLLHKDHKMKKKLWKQFSQVGLHHTVVFSDSTCIL